MSHDPHMRQMLISREIFSPSYYLTILSDLLPAVLLMRGKRPRPASSSPQYERIIWVEKKTARGTKLTAKASGSPRTPKIKRQMAPLSKMRRVNVSPTIQMGPSVEVDHITDPPVTAFKKKPGKVSIAIFINLIYLPIAWVQPIHDTLSEWLLFRDTYISEILDLKKLPASQTCLRCQSQQGCFRCKECFSQDLLCRTCCFTVHRNMPLHHLEKWTGQFFDPTSLNQEGFILHLGHGGEPCPADSTRRGQQDTQPGSSDEGEGEGDDDGILLTGWEERDKKCLVIVDISGIHQLRINWCQCKTAAEPHIQLLRNRFFPASIKRPLTAFTFSLLDHFHIDTVECKTSASSFFSKLRRLTNSSSPHSVPVCSANVLQNILC